MSGEKAECERCGKEEAELSYVTVVGKYGYYRCMYCGHQFIRWVEDEKV